MDISFDLNDTVVKIGRTFNTRRNTRFTGRGDKMEQNNDVGLISPPTTVEILEDQKIIDL
jgi:hypothetical protein